MEEFNRLWASVVALHSALGMKGSVVLEDNDVCIGGPDYHVIMRGTSASDAIIKYHVHLTALKNDRIRRIQEEAQEQIDKLNKL